MEVLHNLQVPLVGAREVGDYIMGDRETLSTSQVHFYPIFVHDAIHRWPWITWRCPEDFTGSQLFPNGIMVKVGPQQFSDIDPLDTRRRNLARTTS